MQARSNFGRAPNIRKISRDDLRLTARRYSSEITQIALSSRFTRMQRFNVTCYLVGDVLIDTGFTKIGSLIGELLGETPISAIACTHSHEDHAGNCQLLGNQHRCPVLLARPESRWEEGVGKLPLYRRIWFGSPPPYVAREMPEVVEGERTRLRAIPIPGHSATHTAFFSENDGTLFAGDLFISSGVTAVMRHENPYASIESLRRAAALSPRRLLNGHGLILDRPAKILAEKAQKIEDAAGQAVRLHEQGLSDRAIQRRVFPSGGIKDRVIEIGTAGEFSRLNFVRACIRHHQLGAPGKREND